MHLCGRSKHWVINQQDRWRKIEQKRAKSKLTTWRQHKTVVPNQRRRKSQIHRIKSLNIMRHSYNHSIVHPDQAIWHQELINKTHSSSAISHSIHLGTGLFRYYLPGCVLSSGCMGWHHRGTSGNTRKKTTCKLSHVLCLIHLASASPLHHTLKNRVWIWIHNSLTIGCPWESTPLVPAPPGAETRVENTLSAWNRRREGISGSCQLHGI